MPGLLTGFWMTALNRPASPSPGWNRLARQVLKQAETWRSASDRELESAAVALRFDCRSGTITRDQVRSVYALVCEAARRRIGLQPYAVQIIGAIALQTGCVAEMQTGEGKTLTATMPLVLAAFRGLTAHLATANDYLAQRDADWMQPVYELLGLSTGAVTGELSTAERRRAYDCDIVYGTAREFGFDFLRDRLALRARGSGETPLFAETLRLDAAPTAGRLTLQKHPPGFILLDEADSLLIDEARTPLIISSPDSDQPGLAALFQWCAQHAAGFESGRYVDLDETTGQRSLTPNGWFHLRQLPRPPELDPFPLSEIAQGIIRAIHVTATLQRDRHYIVRDGRVEIVDEFTGRVADGRRWRNGIHQAVEAREGVTLTPLTGHCARITVQELVSQYDLVSGMTGTAASATRELRTTYGLPVIRIPTRLPSRRQVRPPRVVRTEDERWALIVRETQTLLQSGRPVLIGTRTIEQSEHLAARLSEAGIPHEVLNARQPAREAAIVAEAGQSGRVTVATNMAGRGTDIRLSEEATERGGLHVICSEPHASARIDQQLAGRCARQGDPGSFQQFYSLEDDVYRQAVDAGAILPPPDRLNASDLAGMLDDVRDAQRFIERQHAEERRLLLAHSRQIARQLKQLGQDPWLDAV